jgi:hypothetical protein
MSRILLLVVSLPMCAISAQGTRFRYNLVDDPTLPANVRREIDSLTAIDDSVHGCLPRSDTLWASNLAATIPRRWLDASLHTMCGFAGLPNAVRRRLRDDPGALLHYERAYWAPETSREARANAVALLSWSRDPRYLPLLVHAAQSEIPTLLPQGTYNAAYNAIVELSPYVATSIEARNLVERSARHPRSVHAREAGVTALVAANDFLSRHSLRLLPYGWVSQYHADRVRHVLSHPPCARGLIFVVHTGVEGQDYSRCELPPDYR